MPLIAKRQVFSFSLFQAGYDHAMKTEKFTIVLLSLVVTGCAKAQIVDYSLPQSVQEKNALEAMQQEKMKAIYDIERVLVTGSLNVEMPDSLTSEELNKQNFDNSGLGIGRAVREILTQELAEALPHTLQLMRDGISYSANSIIYCGNYTGDSFNEIEAAIHAFVCDKNLASQHVNLSNPELSLLNETIPVRENAELSIATADLHPYETIEWYVLTADGITPIPSKDDKILLPNIESTSVIFAVAKSEHDSLLKQFIWILTPEEEPRT